MRGPDPLFDLPNVAPLARPKRVKPGTGPVTYTNYNVKWRPRCDDCLAYTLERLQEGLGSPLARAARFKRTQAGESVLICAEHANLRREEEQGLPTASGDPP